MPNKRDKHMNRWITEGVIANPSGESNVSYYDDPTTLGFNLFFEFDSEHSPLLNQSDKGESAVRYLENIDEPERAAALREFIQRLRDVVTLHPYFFTTITGLENIYAFAPDAGFEYERELEIETLESIDLRIGNIIERYLEASFDIYHRRWMLPENMRTFRLVILISEIRNIQSYVSNTTTVDGEVDENGEPLTKPVLFPDNMKDISENLSTYVYIFDDCTLNIEGSQRFLGTLDMTEPIQAVNAFSIKTGRMQTSHNVRFLELFSDERSVQGGREKLKTTAGGEEDRSFKGQLKKFKDQAGEFARKSQTTAQEFFRKEADEFLGENDPRRVASRFLTDQVARRLDSKLKQFLFGNVFLTPNTSNLAGEIGDVISGREGIASLNPVRGRFGNNAKQITKIILESDNKPFVRSNINTGSLTQNPNELGNRDVGEQSENAEALENRDVGEQSNNPNSIGDVNTGEQSENAETLALRDVGEQSNNPNSLALRDVGEQSENPDALAIREVGDPSENSNDLSEVNLNDASENPDDLSAVILNSQSENPDQLGAIDAGEQSTNTDDLDGIDTGEQSNNPSDLELVDTNSKSENPDQLEAVQGLPETPQENPAAIEGVDLPNQSENVSQLSPVDAGDKSTNPSDLENVDAGSKSENPADLNSVDAGKQSTNPQQLERRIVGKRSENVSQLEEVDTGSKSKNALRLGRTNVANDNKEKLKSAAVETGKRTTLGKKNFGKVETTAPTKVESPSQFDKVDTGTPFNSGIKSLNAVNLGTVKPMDFTKLFLGNVFGFEKKPLSSVMMTITAAHMGVVPVVASEPSISGSYTNDEGDIQTLGKTTPLDKRKESKDDC